MQSVGELASAGHGRAGSPSWQVLGIVAIEAWLAWRRRGMGWTQ